MQNFVSNNWERLYFIYNTIFKFFLLKMLFWFLENPIIDNHASAIISNLKLHQAIDQSNYFESIFINSISDDTWYFSIFIIYNGKQINVVSN